ncbi:MAG: hypothetical protein ABIP93_18110 [Gemmatimonadaceae bacterium]
MRRFAALLAVVFLAACSSEIEQSTRPNEVSGRYQLLTFGGRTLPAVVSTDSSGVLEMISAELVIGSDQSWTETENFRLTKNGKVTAATTGSSGSWVFVREYAHMVFNDKLLQYQFTGTVAGGTVRLELWNGNSLVYTR